MVTLLPLPVTAVAFSLIDADGIEHVFNDISGYGVAVGSSFGMEGRFHEPVSLTTENIPVYRGRRVTGVKEDARTLTMPIWIFGDTAAERHGRHRDLSRWFRTPYGSPAIWRNTAVDGIEREVTFYYAGGLEGDESMSVVNDNSALVVAELFVPDGCWYDTADTVETFTLADVPVGAFFSSPFFPLRLSSSTVLSDTTVNNDGDLESWPVWTVTGPGVNPVLRNVTTGEVIEITRTLTGAQQVIVDTRPGHKTVSDGLGSNLFSAIGGSPLWSLPRGLNRVQIEVSSATADTVVEMVWRRAWHSA